MSHTRPLVQSEVGVKPGMRVVEPGIDLRLQELNWIVGDLRKVVDLLHQLVRELLEEKASKAAKKKEEEGHG
jgi:hypothetical protein